MSTVPPSPPCAITRISLSPFARSAAATPLATAGAFAKREWIHGRLQDDSGYGVENTSRQPVAFTAMRRPSVTRNAESRT